ncbi:hypothetical protein C8J57DRAFT_1230493 [Mycena rebaudengoi]|nr:hypothetical protein C8J57DRAFT_1230493 [Mycena rebaudengoi]
MVFIMAEFFMDRVGYDGDGDTLRRSFLFRELSTLFDIMVTHPKYGELGIALPELVATRPNTPEIEEGEISGPSLVNQVDDSSGDVAMIVFGNFPLVATVNEKDVKNVDEDDFLDGFLDDPDVPL